MGVYVLFHLLKYHFSRFEQLLSKSSTEIYEKTSYLAEDELKLRAFYVKKAEFVDDMLNQMDLNILNQQSKIYCAPFAECFQQILIDLAMFSQSESENCMNMNANSDDLSEAIQRTIQLILKSFENVYSKYLANPSSATGDDSLNEGLFVNECDANFIEDLKSFKLDEINQQIATALTEKQIESFGKLLLLCQFVEVYNKFISKWFIILIDRHEKSSECMNALLKIFNDLKHNGFAIPQGEDIEDENEQENNTADKKFEEDQDPAGLGSGKGQKVII